MATIDPQNQAPANSQVSPLGKKILAATKYWEVLASLDFIYQSSAVSHLFVAGGHS